MKSICLIGVGNTIRSDDGIGAYICNAIAELHLPQVSTILVQQLDVEIIEELLPFDHIIIVDASLLESDVALYELTPDNSKPSSSSHHTNAAMLVALAETLYQKKLSIFVCAVKGEDLSIGNFISAKAKINCDKAIDLLLTKIQALQS